jgi:hypothetical protein
VEVVRNEDYSSVKRLPYGLSFKKKKKKKKQIERKKKEKTNALIR